MDGSLNGETWRFIVRNIRIGVVEDDPASCQLVLDYLNRYQSETGEQFTVSVFDDGARIVERSLTAARFGRLEPRFYSTR